MPRCDYQDKYCDEYGYERPEFPGRFLCMKHYEKCKRIHNQLVRAYKAHGLAVPEDKEFE